MFLWDFLQKFTRGFFMQPQMQKRLALFLTGLCVFALAAPQIAPVSAQATQATVQEILDGNQVFIQNQRASLKDVAKQQQQVRTGNSRTALLFNSGAVARLSANSVLKIGQCARLKRGTILVNGAINACSSGITTGVRGTTYLLTVNESGNQQVQVLEGEVIVKRNATPSIDEDDEPTNKPTDKPTDKPTNTTKPSTQKPKVNSTTTQKVKQFTLPPVNTPNNTPLPQDNPQQSRPLEPLNASPSSDKPILKVEQGSQPTKQPDEVVLKSGQELSVDNKGVLGIIQQITESNFTALLKGSLFEGFTNQIPGIDKVKAAFEGLFPGANFPISLPNIPIPSIPTPSLPRFPF
jgi:hypothetical protein